MWRRRTAITAIQSSLTWRRTIPSTEPISSGSLTSPTSLSRRASYVAVILDAWSRRVVGYAISRSIDVRLTLAALNAAIEDREPPPGCLHHSDRGSQYAAQAYRQALDGHGSSVRWGGAANPRTTPKSKVS